MNSTPGGSALVSVTFAASTVPVFVALRMYVITPSMTAGFGALVTLAATSRPSVVGAPHWRSPGGDAGSKHSTGRTVTPIAAALLPGTVSGPSDVTEATSTTSPATGGASAEIVTVADAPAVSSPSAHRPSAPGPGEASTYTTPG